MDESKVKIFIKGCIIYGTYGHLNLSKPELICFYKECIVMAQFIQDNLAIIQASLVLGESYEELYQFAEALAIYEEMEKLASKESIKLIKGCVFTLIGRVYKSLNKYREAIEYAKRGLCIAIETGDKEAQLTNLANLGNAYSLLGEHHDEVIENYEKCLNIAIQIGDKKAEGIAYTNLSGIFCKVGKYNKAIEYGEKGVCIAIETGSKETEEGSYINLRSAYFSLGKYQEAIVYYEKSLSIEIAIGYKTSQKLYIYTELGNVYLLLEKYSEVIECGRKGLRVAMEIGDKNAEVKNLINLGAAYDSTGKHHEAIEYLEKSVKIARERGDRMGEGNAYANLGKAYLSLSKYHEAIEYGEKGLRISIAIGEKETEAISLANLGSAYLSLDKYLEAIEYLERSIKIATEIGDKKREGNAYVNLGNVKMALSKFDEAIDYFEKGLKIALELGAKKLEGITYKSYGCAYLSLNKYDEAIKYFEKCIKIAKVIGDKTLEGATYNDFGDVYSSLGKYHEAIQYVENGLRVSMEIGNKHLEGNIYTVLGNIYWIVSKYHEAIECGKNALRISKEIGDKRVERASYNNLGNAYWSLHKNQEAIKSYERSLEIAIEINDIKGAGNAYTSLGNVNFSLGKYREAIEYGVKGLRIADEIGDKMVEGTNYMNLGNTYQVITRFHEAINCYEKSLQIAIEIADKHGEALTYFNLGVLHRRLSIIDQNASTRDKVCQENKEKSKSFLEEAVRCYEWVFDHLKEQENLKISIVDTFIKAYKLLATTLIESQQIEEALLVCDRGRARSLADILALKYNINKEITSICNPLQYSHFENVLLNNDFCISFFVLLDKNLANWIIAHQKPLALFFVENTTQGFTPTIPEPYIAKRQEHDMEKTLNKVVNDAYGAIRVRQPVKCEDRSLESFQYYRNTEKIDQSNLTSSFAGNQDTIGGSEQKTHPLEILFNLLVQPEINHEEIVIIPEGPLYMVPFAALRDPNTGLFLSETKRIRLAPSLTTLKTLQECPVDCHSKIGALIVGDPDIGEVMLGGKKTLIPRLPSAEHEAKILGSMLNVKPLTGPQATKEIVKQKLKEGVAVIHIATHGSSENGHIALAPPPRTDGRILEEQDYMLTMQEVQEIGVRAQLVVLSCCHSGRGEIKSEGVVGMSRAFLAAGARAVVASLWAIDDRATLNFMLSFYMYLKLGKSASKSLQRAINEMREEGFDEPRHWAPFFLIGDDVIISV